jgi:hypothetical protein
MACTTAANMSGCVIATNKGPCACFVDAHEEGTRFVRCSDARHRHLPGSDSRPIGHAAIRGITLTAQRDTSESLHFRASLLQARPPLSLPSLPAAAATTAAAAATAAEAALEIPRSHPAILA